MINIIINGKNNEIKKEDINSFRSQQGGGRGKNDGNNSIREKIIYTIFDDKKMSLNENTIPEEWYEDEMWRKIRDEVYDFIEKNLPEGITSIKYSAGRQHNYDFLINDKEVEFKFGDKKSITEHAQFLSLHADKLDSDKTYPEYFYDEGYVSTIHEVGNIDADILNRDEYLKTIRGNNYDIKPLFRTLYDKENESRNFKEAKKILVDKSIHDFLSEQKDKIDIIKLNEILKPQSKKIYMVYNRNGQKFYHDQITESECTITSINTLKAGRNGQYNTIIFNTQNENTTLHFLLRWKNHAGILLPAWQISIKRN
tara:strand:+ start:2251 stop:3186 length:936 start_codon:yes stop_codon:yes gene_type:complete